MSSTTSRVVGQINCRLWAISVIPAGSRGPGLASRSGGIRSVPRFRFSFGLPVSKGWRLAVGRTVAFVRCLFKPHEGIDEVQRTLLHLLIDSADVLPDDTQTDELDTSHEEHCHYHRRPPLNDPRGKELEPDRIRYVYETDEGDGKAQISGQLER
jgi:hypothetical protein